MRIELAEGKLELLKQQAREHIKRGWGDQKSEKSALTKLSKPVVESINLRKAIAGEAGISEGTVENYMDIRKNGDPELMEQVRKGEMKIYAAQQRMEATMIKRLKKAERMYLEMYDYLPLENDPEGNREAYAILTALYEKLTKLIAESSKND